jgi:hypothetical protein
LEGWFAVWCELAKSAPCDADTRHKCRNPLISRGQKEKGPLDDERPKSREETPKEGSETSDAIASLASHM